MTDETLDLLNRTASNGERKILIRGGHVLSMNQEIGDLVGDVLIEGSKIAAVGPAVAQMDVCAGAIDIDAAGAIVIPGLVDSHLHAWQAALSGLVPDVSLPEYLATIHGFYFGPPGAPGLAAMYRPQDMRIGTLVSSLRCLASGVTCVIDNCHNARTPEHSDAAIQGLAEARIRAVHAAGAPLDGTRTEDWPADVLRLRDEYFGSEDQLLTLRLFGLPEPELWEMAREHGFWTSCETGAWVEADLRRLFDAGLMSANHTFNHCAALSEEMWQRIRDCGATVNLCARSDTSFLVERAIPPLAEALAHEVPVGLSMDTEVSYSIDMFAEMRTLLHLARGRSAPLVPGEEPHPPLIGVSDILRLVTRGGAANAALGDRIGSLTPGKAADVVMIRPDGLSLRPRGNLAAAVVSYATPNDVDAVFVDGQVRKWKGQLCGHDLEHVREQLDVSREYLLSAFGARFDPFEARFWAKERK